MNTDLTTKVTFLGPQTAALIRRVTSLGCSPTYGALLSGKAGPKTHIVLDLIVCHLDDVEVAARTHFSSCPAAHLRHDRKTLISMSYPLAERLLRVEATKIGINADTVDLPDLASKLRFNLTQKLFGRHIQTPNISTYFRRAARNAVVNAVMRRREIQVSQVASPDEDGSDGIGDYWDSHLAAAEPTEASLLSRELREVFLDFLQRLKNSFEPFFDTLQYLTSSKPRTIGQIAHYLGVTKSIVERRLIVAQRAFNLFLDTGSIATFLLAECLRREATASPHAA